MAKITIKQYDITDCGAACLASMSSHFNLQIPISRIRQYAGTDKKGTNILSFLIRIVKGLSLRITFFLRDVAISFFKNEGYRYSKFSQPKNKLIIFKNVIL
jgi:ABC-type bacteriocin/lantibiotic exporter with double-glycine peptidase domain